MLRHDVPPRDTVYWYSRGWAADVTCDRIHDPVRAAARVRGEEEGHRLQPPHRGRHNRPAGRRAGHRGQPAGPRRSRLILGGPDDDALDRAGAGRRMLQGTVPIVKTPPGPHPVEALSRRRVVERSLSRLVRCHRLGHDYERLPAHAETMVKWAMIGLMTRRQAQAPEHRPMAVGNSKMSTFPAR